MPPSASPCATSSMWGKWSCEPPAWPVAPRPFAEEPIGGWLGRVAARYCMSVDELAGTYGLELAFDRTSGVWLLLTRISEATISKLSALARIDRAAIIALEPPQCGPTPRPQLAYCAACVFLNPQDVTSPCWKREWMDPAQTRCSIHDMSLQRLPFTSLRQCGNFDHVLRVVSRREARKREHRW